MKSLRDYITESEAWVGTPAPGDEFDIEVAPDELVEAQIVESDGENILLEVSDSGLAALEKRGLVSERIARYGAVGSNRGMGYTVSEETMQEDQEPQPVAEDFMSRMLELAGCGKMEEDQPITPNNNAAHNDPLAQKAADLAPVGTEQDPTTATTIDEGAMKDIDIARQDLELMTDQQFQAPEIKGGYGMSKEAFRQKYRALLNPAPEQDVPVEEDLEIDEAEYQGRKVPLGKPMRGDVKKFKVYVKDPKTGNVKKVNFGHGGTSAKRAGQKTMKIKKSNPARRKSFRARHNCDNPGPRTKARYWSCRAW
jgi:hypothetical protein